MDKILVTGGSGQVGSDLKSLKAKSGYKFFFPSSKELDIRKKNSLSSFLETNKINLVLNLAAYTDVDNAEKKRKLAKDINFKGPLNLSLETSKRNIGLIHFSTDYVFGKKNISINSYKRTTSPVNYYGLTKSQGEEAVLSNSHLGLIIRLASVYGLSGNNFIKTVVKLLLTSSEVRVVNDQKISLTGSYELATNIFYLIDLYKEKIENRNFSPKIIHFTNKGYSSWYKVAKVVKNELELNLKKKVNAKLIPIKSADWESLAARPLDSRLKVDYSVLEKNNIYLPKWEKSVRSFVKKILPIVKSDIKNEH